MADFAHYFPVLLANEGGYCHDPQDPGGETYRGVARVPNPDWRGWPLVDTVKTRLGAAAPVPRPAWLALSRTLAAEPGLSDLVQHFYKGAYWDSLGLDGVHSQCVAEQLADHGVNAGTARPAKMLQYLLNTEFGAHLLVDGKLGPHTIAALNALEAKAFYARFVAMRQAFYGYRTGSFPAAEAGSLAAWHQFFQDELHLHTDRQMQKYLPTWLRRTQVAFTA